MSDGWFEADVIAAGVMAAAAAAALALSLYQMTKRRQRELERTLESENRKWRDRMESETHDNTQGIAVLESRMQRIDGRLNDVDSRERDVDAKLSQLIDGQGELRGTLRVLTDLVRKNGGH